MPKKRKISDEIKQFAAIGAGMAPSTAVGVALAPLAKKRIGTGVTSTKKISDPIVSKMQRMSEAKAKAKVDVRADTLRAQGFGTYSPSTFTGGNPEVNLHTTSTKKLTAFQKGIASHELGHHVNFSRMGRKGRGLYMAGRVLTGTSALGGAVMAATIKDDKKALGAAALASIPGAAQFAEEATATGRGLKMLSKSYGHKGKRGMLKTLKKGKWGAGRSTAVNLLSYGAMAAAPGLAYAARKMLNKKPKRRPSMDKKATLEEIRNAAFMEEIEMIKSAGKTSEEVMTGLGAMSTVGNTAKFLAAKNPAAAAAVAIGGAAPYVVGRLTGPKTKSKMKKQNKSGWAANTFLPFVAPYRLGRRHATRKHGYAKK